MIPGDELIEVSMTVEEAFTLIISAGIVTPPEHRVPRNVKPVALIDYRPLRPNDHTEGLQTARTA